MTDVDVIIKNEGSIVLFYPASEAAKEWWEENVDPDAMTFGDSFVVEHRYAHDIIEGLQRDGFIIN